MASPARSVLVLTRLSLILIACALIFGTVSAQPAAQGGSDLDAFMSRVLQRRDDNWKKLQQYVLEERETIQITGPGAKPIWGTQREYAWFPRDGVFIKSPLKADGVTISESERRKAEQAWIEREQRREKRRAERARNNSNNNTPDTKTESAAAGTIDTAVSATTEANIRDALEPGFVSAAYFMQFKFDPGQYALAGREKFEGRDVLRIEYYPAHYFNEGRQRPNKKVRDRDAEIETKMDKSALITLWIDPAEHQILKYDFRNLPLDFMPGRSIVRIDGLKAAMEMSQPFPNVWLPRSIRIGFDMSLANRRTGRTLRSGLLRLQTGDRHHEGPVAP
jgi:hypothetical protein